MRFRRPTAIGGICLASVLTVGVVSCKDETPRPGGRSQRSNPNATLSVRVAPVTRGRLVYTIQATGTAAPDAEAKISARTEGQILTIDVREGDQVKKEQVLVVQDNAVLAHEHELAKSEAEAAEARLAKLVAGNRPEEIAASAAEVAKAEALTARARAEVESARAKMEEAKTNAKMFESMFRQGVVSPQQRLATQTEAQSTSAVLAEIEAKLRENEAALQAAKARFRLMRAGAREEDVKAARSELARARENASLLRVKMEHAVTRAPITGIVSERLVEPGDLARVGTHLLSLVNTEQLRILTQISELDLPKVKRGQAVDVGFDAFPNRKFKGRVQRIHPTVDPASRQATVEVALKNPKGELPSGLLARVQFVSHSARETLLVPKRALVRRVQGERHEVFVVKPHKKAASNGNGLGAPAVRPATSREASAAQNRKLPPSPQYIAESRKVVAGEIAGNLAEIKSGLSPGDQVVVRGQSRLRPGHFVKIIP